jgi:coenzyme F420-reducing hydrogenase gamma subunit
MKGAKKKLAVWKFASCDGCQLSILDCEDELLMIADQVEIAYFPEATKTIIEGPYDISLVEGSVTTPHDAIRILEIRKNSGLLISIGACATAGGIQALRNYVNVSKYVNAVYAKPKYIQTLETSTPISDHIHVDYELRGCPVNKYQLIEVLSSFLHGKAPSIPNQSVCMDCKLNGNPCVAVSRGLDCLGPVTQAGCGAICPHYYRGCFGCYGPKERPNVEALARYINEKGTDSAEISRLFSNFNAGAKEFSTIRQEYHGRE